MRSIESSDIGMPCRSRIWDWISSTARESKPRSLKGTSAISLSSVTASSVPALDRMISMRSSRVIIVSSSYVVPWSTAYDQRGVEAAVAAGEDECRPDGCLAARADDEIQLVFWYRVPNAHGRRDHPVADREQRRDDVQRQPRVEPPGHGLRHGYRHRPRAEHLGEHARLGPVEVGHSGAVGEDHVDLVGPHTGVGERLGDGPAQARRQLGDQAVRAQRCVGTTGDHEPRAGAQRPAGMADRVDAAGLLRGDHAAWTAHAVPDRDLAGARGVEPGDRLVGGHVLRSLAPQPLDLALAELGSAGRAGRDDGHVVLGQLRGSDRGVDQAGQPNRVAGRIEPGDRPDPAAPVPGRRPVRIGAQPVGGDHADPGDHRRPAHQTLAAAARFISRPKVASIVRTPFQRRHWSRGSRWVQSAGNASGFNETTHLLIGTVLVTDTTITETTNAPASAKSTREATAGTSAARTPSSSAVQASVTGMNGSYLVARNRCAWTYRSGGRASSSGTPPSTVPANTPAATPLVAMASSMSTSGMAPMLGALAGRSVENRSMRRPRRRSAASGRSGAESAVQRPEPGVTAFLQVDTRRRCEHRRSCRTGRAVEPGGLIRGHASAACRGAGRYRRGRGCVLRRRRQRAAGVARVAARSVRAGPPVAGPGLPPIDAADRHRVAGVRHRARAAGADAGTAGAVRRGGAAADRRPGGVAVRQRPDQQGRQPRGPRRPAGRLARPQAALARLAPDPHRVRLRRDGADERRLGPAPLRNEERRMPFAATVAALRPGSAQSVFAELTPGATPGARAGDTGSPAAGRGLLAAAAFVRDNSMGWVVQHGENTGDVAQAMAEQPEIAIIEKLVAPYLQEPDASGDPRRLAAAFRSRMMQRVQQRIVREAPSASLAALHYRVRDGYADEIARVFTAVRPEARPVLRDDGGVQTGVLHGVAVFVGGGWMVRVVSFDGDLADVAKYMAHRPGRPAIERELAPYLAEPRDTAEPEEFLRRFDTDLMPQAARLALTG